MGSNSVVVKIISMTDQKEQIDNKAQGDRDLAENT